MLPKYTGRPWKTNAVVAISWNAVLFLVLLAFLHHLYMDFAQPVSLQYIGQVASYLSAVPATVVTVFGVIGQVYRSGMQWRFVPLCFCLGIIGWVIGGFAAVVDSTITVNFVFHNTLWVPAHFHTYFLGGYFLMLWGFLYEFSGSAREKLAKAGLWLLVAGAYGFLFMFYLGGALGVPRRFAAYSSIPIPSLATISERTACIASAFVVLLIIGLLFVFGVIYGGLANRSSPARPLRPATNSRRSTYCPEQSRNNHDILTKRFIGLLVCVPILGGGVGLVVAWTLGFSAFTSYSYALNTAGPVPRAASDISFVDQFGHERRLASLRGRHVLLHVFYGSCLTICPIVIEQLRESIPISLPRSGASS